MNSLCFCSIPKLVLVMAHGVRVPSEALDAVRNMLVGRAGAKGEVYLETECPRGQMGFYLVSNGTAIPWRTRAKSSCFCNLSVTSELCAGVLLTDVPAIVGSLDVVMGEIDR